MLSPTSPTSGNAKVVGQDDDQQGMSRPIAIAYLRARDARPIERQIDSLMWLARKLGASLVEAFPDLDPSRTGYARLLAYVARNRPAYLLAMDPSRLTEDLDELAKLADLTEACGTEVRTVMGGGLRPYLFLLGIGFTGQEDNR